MDICYIKKKSLTLKVKQKHITFVSLLLDTAIIGVLLAIIYKS